PFMVVHAALAVVLARLSATDDIAIATPIAGRGQAVLEPLVGMFVNTLVLRADVTPGMSFTDLLEQVRATDLNAFAHADVPFESVVEALDPVRSEAFEPLAQVILSFAPGASLADADITVDGLSVQAMPLPYSPAPRDLTVEIIPTGSQWRGHTTYATDLFDESSIESMMEQFVGVLEQLLDDPRRRVGDVPMQSADYLRRVATWSAGPHVDDGAVTLAGLLGAAGRGR
ncbi:hypothetical protein HH308_29335, partial [Gordonia sp. TBRC 11910]